MRKRYTVVIKDVTQSTDLIKLVNQLMDQGWEPQGGVATNPNTISQAMVIEVPEKPKNEETAKTAG
jgi:hypothetical protein